MKFHNPFQIHQQSLNSGFYHIQNKLFFVYKNYEEDDILIYSREGEIKNSMFDFTYSTILKSLTELDLDFRISISDVKWLGENKVLLKQYEMFCIEHELYELIK
jgi:hypothetical protein